MADKIEAIRGDALRLICPLCKTMWSTYSVPAECPECAAKVTITARKPKTDAQP